MKELSLRQYCEKQGCDTKDKKTQYHWSFINREDKIIIFGAFEHLTKGNRTCILEKTRETKINGHSNPSYKNSLEHIRLIIEDSYQLWTVKITTKNPTSNGVSKPKIIDSILHRKSLEKVGDEWYAVDYILSNLLPEEIDTPEQYFEGASRKIYVNTYERNADARKKCLEHFGYKCAICEFDFESFYGEIGEYFIHVHHVTPLAEIRKEYALDPIEDLVPVCPNCHAMIHRTRPALTVNELKQHLTS